MTHTIFRKKGIGAFILVLIILFCFYPYEFTSVYFRFVPRNIFFTVVVTVIVGLLYYFNSRRTRIPQALFLIAIVQFIGLLIHSIHMKQNLVGQISNVFSVLPPLLLVMYVESTIGLLEFYRRYNRWILIMAVLGTIAWILVTFANFAPLYIVQSRSDVTGERLISNYLLTFSPSELGVNMRYAGFFDEPGAMGYWGLYALLINKLFIKEKKLELLLSICLLLTFSMGYYFQFGLYLILFNVNVKNFKRALLYVALLSVIFLGINMTKGTAYNGIYEATVGRVSDSIEQSRESEDALAVDSRSGLTAAGKEQFLKNPLLGSTNEAARYGNNIYEPLAKYGLIGAPLVLFPFLYWLYIAIMRKDRDFLKAFLVVFLGFTHRPFHIALLYFFVVYSIILMYLRYGVSSEMRANVKSM